jgi:hypothetical protein
MKRGASLPLSTGLSGAGNGIRTALRLRRGSPRGGTCGSPASPLPPSKGPGSRGSFSPADPLIAGSNPSAPGGRDMKRGASLPLSTGLSGAGNGIRTRDPNLGKVVLYQLSYSRPARKYYPDWPATVKGSWAPQSRDGSEKDGATSCGYLGLHYAPYHPPRDWGHSSQRRRMRQGWGEAPRALPAERGGNGPPRSEDNAFPPGTTCTAEGKANQSRNLGGLGGEAGPRRAGCLGGGREPCALSPRGLGEMTPIARRAAPSFPMS